MRGRLLLPLAASLMAASALTSCKDSNSEPPKPVAATPVNPATAGSISVQVRYEGSVPEGQPVNMSSAPGCAKLHAGAVYDRTLVVSGGGLSNAVVYIKDGLQGWVFAPPSQAVTLDQTGCLFQPRVAAAMVGQGVQFENSDPETHNVHGRPKAVDAWNFLMTRQGQTRTLYFDQPEIGIQVGCDIHPWMRAYLCVLPNPYFGVTGRDGLAQLRNLPPGTYTVAAWHESLGTREQQVELVAKGELALTFTYEGK